MVSKSEKKQNVVLNKIITYFDHEYFENEYFWICSIIHTAMILESFMLFSNLSFNSYLS